MKFGLQEDISLPLVFVDGLARCGKSAFSGIISSLKNVENIQFSTEIELVLSGLAMGAIDPDYAKSFMRIYFNERSYNLQISRNVNFRPNDQTGIENYPNPQIYYDRLKLPEGDEVVQRCRHSNNLLPFITHDFFVNLDLLDKLDLNYKMILLWRNPIDNIYSWWMRGWGNRFNDDPRGFTLLLQGDDELFPWYSARILNELSGLNGLEKCILNVADLLKRGVNQYKAASRNSNIHTVTFEDFCENPDDELKKICIFLGTEITSFTSNYLKIARFPRNLNDNDREKKLHKMKQECRPDIHKIVIELAANYDSLYGIRDDKNYS